MVSRSLVLGYHGRDLSTVEKIVSGKDDLIFSKTKTTGSAADYILGKTATPAPCNGRRKKQLEAVEKCGNLLSLALLLTWAIA
jgi:hypothetical protein